MFAFNDDRQAITTNSLAPTEWVEDGFVYEAEYKYSNTLNKLKELAKQGRDGLIGRMMSRTAARKNLDLDEEKRLLDEKGIIHAIKNVDDLDEAASAYKDIDVVMKEQEDLVDILVTLEPLAVIKG